MQPIPPTKSRIEVEYNVRNRTYEIYDYSTGQSLSVTLEVVEDLRMSGPDDLITFFKKTVYGMKDDAPLDQQVERLKIQVQMLQGIVDGLQAEKKVIATTVKQVMKDDKLIAEYISGELKRISEEAVKTAREQLIKKADNI